MDTTFAARMLRDALLPLPDVAPVGDVAVILNPLDYAWDNHQAYTSRFAPAGHTVEALLVGMNPGPFGMAQTGIPFGSPDLVRDFLGLQHPVRVPRHVHPRRPIEGINSQRTEVSGQRLWGLIRDCFGTPEAFFQRFYIANDCPLAFQSETGANLTPDHLPRGLWQSIEGACDAHLLALIETLQPQMLLGFGKWAEKRLARVVKKNGLSIPVSSLLHPSPASPAANKGWREKVLGQLEALGHAWPPPR